jgi:hypothetical protein
MTAITTGTICITPDQLAYAMGAAQGQILSAAAYSQVIFMIAGIVVGVVLSSVFWYMKIRIDEIGGS